MHILLKLLSIRKTICCLFLLSAMAAFTASCRQQAAEEFPTRRTIDLPVADSVPTPSLKAFIHCYYGRRYINTHRYEEALQCFSQAAAILDKKQLTASYANALRNMGRVHLLSSRPDSALYCYLQAQEAVADFNPALFMDISTEFSIICRYVDDWDEAKEQMLQYRRRSAMDELPMRRLSDGLFLMKEDFIRGRREALSVLRQKDFRVDDFRQFASQYQELYTVWCGMDAEQQEFDRDLKERYNNEVLKNENQLIRNELLRRKVWMLSLGLGSVLLIGAGFVVFYLYRRNIESRIGQLLARLRENEKQLDEGRSVSEEQRHRLMKENEGLSLQIEKLSARQKDKDKLNSFLQKQNVQYTKQLKDYQELHGLLPVERTLALSRIYRLRCEPVYGLVKSDEEWMEVFAAIDALYGDMSAKLKDFKLGMQERRICYLIRAGFTNGMIATISNVTTDAVAKSKQRMKTKFSLRADDVFDDFIRGL